MATKKQEATKKAVAHNMSGALKERAKAIAEIRGKEPNPTLLKHGISIPIDGEYRIC